MHDAGDLVLGYNLAIPHSIWLADLVSVSQHGYPKTNDRLSATIDLCGSDGHSGQASLTKSAIQPTPSAPDTPCSSPLCTSYISAAITEAAPDQQACIAVLHLGMGAT